MSIVVLLAQWGLSCGSQIWIECWHFFARLPDRLKQFETALYFLIRQCEPRNAYLKKTDTLFLKNFFQTSRWLPHNDQKSLSCKNLEQCEIAVFFLSNRRQTGSRLRAANKTVPPASPGSFSGVIDPKKTFQKVYQFLAAFCSHNLPAFACGVIGQVRHYTLVLAPPVFSEGLHFSAPRVASGGSPNFCLFSW